VLKKVLVAVWFVLPLAAVVAYDYRPFVEALLRGEQFGAGGRQSEWAVALQRPPLENLHRVTGDLYRGAQPTADRMRRLDEMGVRTVVNLRRRYSDAELVAGTDLRAVDIHVNAAKPTEAQVVEFLRIVTDPNCTPVYVHCQRGIDRTGMMCAAFRMLVCGWTRDDAIGEMTHGPFGYDGVFQNVPRFLRGLDVERLRRQMATR